MQASILAEASGVEDVELLFELLIVIRDSREEASSHAGSSPPD